MLIPLGLYLFGITDLAFNGIVSIIDWAQSTVWSTTMTWGASLAGAGLLLFVVSRFVKPAGRKTVAEPVRPTVVAPQSTAGKPAVTGTATPAAANPAPKQAKTAEDAEVEDILRKRGLL